MRRDGGERYREEQLATCDTGSNLREESQQSEKVELIHELQSSTDTVTEETLRNSQLSMPSSEQRLCNGYHGEVASVTEDVDDRNYSENHLVLKKSSSISTSTSDISNSLIECRQQRLKMNNKSPKEGSSHNGESDSRILRIRTNGSSSHHLRKDVDSLSESPSSFFRSSYLSGPRSPSDRNCVLQIGKHLDEDGLTNLTSTDHKRLLELLIIKEKEKSLLREEISELREQLEHYRSTDSWRGGYPGLQPEHLVNCEVPSFLTVEEDDELKPSSVPNSLHSDTSWEQLDDRDQSQTLWVPDHAVTHCHCGHKFNLISRKHHCRNCGRIFCSTCSNFFTAIPREQLYQPQRVCKSCHDSLQEQHQARSGKSLLEKDRNLMKAVTVASQG